MKLTKLPRFERSLMKLTKLPRFERGLFFALEFSVCVAHSARNPHVSTYTPVARLRGAVLKTQLL
jgi:hypothetical protein